MSDSPSSSSQRKRYFILKGPDTWEEWATRLKSYMERKGFWGIVSGQDACPTASEDDETCWDIEDDAARWIQKNADARGYIIDNCDSRNLNLIRLCTAAKAAFDFLSRKYESNSTASIGAKIRQLIITTQTTDMCTFTQRVATLQCEIETAMLANPDISLLDILAIAVVIKGAHGDFFATIAAIQQQRLTSYDAVRQALDHEAERLGYEGKGVTKPTTTQHRARTAEPTSFRPPRRDAKDDPFGPAVKPEGTGRPKCDHCGTVGHSSDRCWGLPPELKVERKPKPATAKAATVDQPPPDPYDFA